MIKVYAHFCDFLYERAKIDITTSAFIEDLLASKISRHYFKRLMKT